ncbi:MAG: isoprenylcysteine carboxylmethyltransferase family protein [Acutalibacteraceae bacterium]|nr:isoprenylcysteine carboxylmethyltransferase family protein [Acutalibacteraceae bacterium]
MKKREHLPLYGVGPFIGVFQVAITIIGVILSYNGYLEFGKIELLNIPLKIIGFILIIFGAYLFYGAHYKAKLFDKVSNNQLVTTGVYSIVRNPVYSGILSACTGVVCITNNVVLFIVPVICWAFISIVLKLSEEKWLKNLYGDEYVKYCTRVNRCIPWLSKNK